MGAPFQLARIVVSLKNMRAEVNFLVCGQENKHATVEIPSGSGESAFEAGEAIVESAAAEGLIAEGSAWSFAAAARNSWPSLRKRRNDDC